MLIRLPATLLVDLLHFLDGPSLASLEVVCKALRQLVDDESHWKEQSRTYRWVYPQKPSWTTWKDLYVKLRLATSPNRQTASSGSGSVGCIYVIGGCYDRPGPVGLVEKFFDTQTVAQHPGPSHVLASSSIAHAASGPLRVPTQPPAFRKVAAPPMLHEKAACGVARDAEDRVWVVGGWTHGHALSSVEILGADRSHWIAGPSMTSARCFVSSVADLQSRVWAFGGGNSVWRGAEVLSTTEYLELQPGCGNGVLTRWKAGPPMKERRCGASATVTERGEVYIAGGYRGGDVYHKSMEMLPCGGSSFVQVAPMNCPRTGFGLSYGPDGCIYAVGGSPDGAQSHASAERFDPRVGVWEPLPRMMLERGYCSSCFGATGTLYVVGGHSDAEDEVMVPAVECFDAVAQKWRLYRGSESDGIMRVDLACVYSLT